MRRRWEEPLDLRTICFHVSPSPVKSPEEETEEKEEEFEPQSLDSLLGEEEVRRRGAWVPVTRCALPLLVQVVTAGRTSTAAVPSFLAPRTVFHRDHHQNENIDLIIFILGKEIPTNIYNMKTNILYMKTKIN